MSEELTANPTAVSQPASAEPLLRMTGIVKRFGGTTALGGASLEVAPGEVHALVGENGSGKSTLMKVLSGIHRPDAGEIVFNGRRVEFHSSTAATDAGIAIVHQELNLVGVLSAAENLYLGREMRTPLGTVDYRGMRDAAGKLFKELEIDVDPSVTVERLPVALRQMVEIARALTRKARLLILDEPTSAISESEVQVLFKIVKRLRSEGTSIIYISHKMAELFTLADRYTVLRDGKTVGGGVMANVTEPQIVQSMVGRELGDYYPPRSEVKPDAQEILRIEDLTQYASNGSGRAVVRNASLTLRAGEIVGIAGLVGAGRTELFETLFGAGGKNWSGRIVLDGREIRPRSPRHAIELGIALVTEDRAAQGIFRQQSVLANATIANLPRLARMGTVSVAREKAALAEQAETMRIRRASDNSLIEELSGGNQQKVILARWLMTNPRVLLLDEPTRGIDVGAKAEIYRVLRQLSDAGIGVLFVSSELPEVLGLADRIIVMSAGRITADVAARDATENSLMEAAMAEFSMNKVA